MTLELSVVVPTRNRRRLVMRCLESLAAQTAPPSSFEVVVAVDGSEDGTAEALDALDLPYIVTVLIQPPGGPGAARNAGAAKAAGEVLLFIDDDVVASPTLVAAHLDVHRRNGSTIVGVGTIDREIPSAADGFSRRRAEAARGHNDRLAARALSYGDCYGGNFSVSRELFQRVGGFAVDLPEENDFELSYRLSAAGATFVFVPGGGVTEERDDGWREIVVGQQRRGRIAVELIRRHPEIAGQTELGGFGGEPRRFALLRKWLLFLRAPPPLLARLGFFIPHEGWSGRWFDFVYLYAYWFGARTSKRRPNR